MSRLADARTRILDALAAGGIRTGVSGKLAPPVVLVEPGDPWTEPARLPGRTSRWRLTAISGAADHLAAVDELADLVDRVDTALRTIDGAQLPTWSRPAEIEVTGPRKAFATLGTIQLASS